MANLSYADLYQLEEFAFIGGTEYTLNFTVYKADGFTPVDLSSMTINWYACAYGQPDYIVLSKAGVLGGTTGTFSVTILSSDTVNLSGKFIQQPSITDFSGVEYRYGQGVFTILPKIKNV